MTLAPQSHKAMIAPISRSFAATAQLAAIRALETSGALTPAMARDARARVADGLTWAERAARKAMEGRA